MGGNLTLEIIVLLFIVGFYFLPKVFAKQRDINNFGVIVGINLLFGWTVLGWVAALIWAILEPPKLKAWSAPSATTSSSPH